MYGSHNSFSFTKAALNSGCCRHACTQAGVFHGPNDINRFFCSKSCNRTAPVLHISLALVQLARSVQIFRNSSSFPCFTDQISAAYIISLSPIVFHPSNLYSPYRLVKYIVIYLWLLFCSKIISHFLFDFPEAS